jgi:hypothetical protein
MKTYLIGYDLNRPGKNYPASGAGAEAVQPGVSDLERVGVHLPLRAQSAAP